MGASSRTAARVLVEQLAIQRVDTVFAVPGESFLAVLDALLDQPNMRLVGARHEGGAAMMADAFGNLTGRPGVCFVTRGPGASNAASGLHIAAQDSTPLILFIGQVARGVMERGAFQEIDYRRVFGSLAKWVAQIDEPARIPEMIARAFRVAMSGRPGPVVLALPEDMLSEFIDVADAPTVTRVAAGVGPRDLERLRSLVTTASRPLLVVGEGGWSTRAADDLRQFAERFGLPVCASFRCQDYLDNDHECYVGDVGIGMNPVLRGRIDEADLIVALGARFGEIPSQGYTLLGIPAPRQQFVQIDPSAEELGRVYQPDLAIQAGLEEATTALATPEAPARVAWSGWRKAARSAYLEWSRPPRTPAGLDLGQIIVWLRERLSDDAILCNGAGNYSVWLHRYFRYRRYRTQLAPICGAMGYGLPAAIAAILVHPQSQVVCLAGDGCLQMSIQELGTAAQEGLGIVVIVVNNRSYGTIRMHQERTFPGRVVGTDLRNPDFAALAESFGALGLTVRHDRDFPDAFDRAIAHLGPSVIELQVDPRVILPGLTIDQLT